MKQLSGLLVLVLFSAMMTFGQTNSQSQNKLTPKKIDSTEIKKILLLEEQYLKAKIERNAQVLDKIMAENYSRKNPDGSFDNKSKVINDILKTPIAKVSLDSMFVEIRDTLAMVKGLITIDSSQFSFNHTFINQKGNWRLLKGEPGKLVILNTHLTDVTIREIPITNEATATRLIREGNNFSPRQIPILEKQLSLNPENISARVRLLGYYFNSGIKDFGPDATHAARLRHILWLIQNHPENPANKLSEASMDSSGHQLADADGYVQVKKLWLEQIVRNKNNTQVLRNAAWQFKVNNKAIAIKCLKQALLLDPKNEEIASQLGYTYGIAILGITLLNNNGLPMGQNPALAHNADAISAIKDVRSSDNYNVTYSTANILTQYGSIIRSIFKDAVNKDSLVEELMIRTVNLKPDLPILSSLLIEYYSTQASGTKIPGQRIILAKKAKVQADIFINKSKSQGDLHLGALFLALTLTFKFDSLDNAKDYATEILKLMPNPPTGKYGLLYHDAYIALGRVALKDGNVELARKDLLNAGHAPGGEALSSSEPNMSLAKELSDHGERDTVIAYLELYKNFRGYSNQVNQWIQTLKEGKTPDFGGNMVH